jgi:hypothetical protein
MYIEVSGAANLKMGIMVLSLSSRNAHFRLHTGDTACDEINHLHVCNQSRLTKLFSAVLPVIRREYDKIYIKLLSEVMSIFIEWCLAQVLLIRSGRLSKLPCRGACCMSLSPCMHNGYVSSGRQTQQKSSHVRDDAGHVLANCINRDARIK